MKNLTIQEIVKRARNYDNVVNEGGEGYNPFNDELERRAAEAARKRAAAPKTKKEQVEALHNRIRIECGSVAREWGNEKIDKKQAGLYAEIKEIEAKIETEFWISWTLEETKIRRESWNGFVKSLMDSNGRISGQDNLKIYAQTTQQGWELKDLKKAVKHYNL